VAQAFEEALDLKASGFWTNVCEFRRALTEVAVYDLGDAEVDARADQGQGLALLV
jgi:hypothetical protein